MSFNAIRENEILAKISDFTVAFHYLPFIAVHASITFLFFIRF